MFFSSNMNHQHLLWPLLVHSHGIIHDPQQQLGIGPHNGPMVVGLATYNRLLLNTLACPVPSLFIMLKLHHFFLYHLPTTHLHILVVPVVDWPYCSGPVGYGLSLLCGAWWQVGIYSSPVLWAVHQRAALFMVWWSKVSVFLLSHCSCEVVGEALCVWGRPVP